jgi:hypothetical protein
LSRRKYSRSGSFFGASIIFTSGSIFGNSADSFIFGNTGMCGGGCFSSIYIAQKSFLSGGLIGFVCTGILRDGLGANTGATASALLMIATGAVTVTARTSGP